MRQLILDTETTGLEAAKGHRIIEFAAIEMIDRKLTGKSLHLYINPECPIDPGATRVHGITDADVANEPKFSEVVGQIADYIKDADLIIHNAKFDLSFMNYQFNLEKYDLVDTYIHDVIDTLILARKKFPGSKNTLDALCDRFKISRENRNFHGALIDCHLLADVYLALTREQISLLGDEEKKAHDNQGVFVRLETGGFNLKIIHPNSTESAQHEEYLKALDKASNGSSAWFNRVKSS